MKKFAFLLSFLVISVSGKSQTIDNVFEDDLARIGREILGNSTYKDRLMASIDFQFILADYVSTKKGYDDNLDAVTNMMRLEGGDDFRIYTWLMPDSVYQNRHFGLVAAKNEKGEIEITHLKDKADEIPQAQFKILKADKWLGALYYKIIPTKNKGETTYTLLGFSPNPKLNKKVIEVIKIDEKGRPKFGAKVFKIEQFQDQTFRQAPMRLILQYNGDVSASVRWNEEEEMIVMDHLAPPDANMKGLYSMYGPTMTYDGLAWKKGWWELENLVDFNSRQDVKIVPPDRPVDLGGGN